MTKKNKAGHSKNKRHPIKVRNTTANKLRHRRD